MPCRGESYEQRRHCRSRSNSGHTGTLRGPTVAAVVAGSGKAAERGGAATIDRRDDHQREAADPRDLFGGGSSRNKERFGDFNKSSRGPAIALRILAGQAADACAPETSRAVPPVI